MFLGIQWNKAHKAQTEIQMESNHKKNPVEGKWGVAGRSGWHAGFKQLFQFHRTTVPRPPTALFTSHCLSHQSLPTLAPPFLLHSNCEGIGLSQILFSFESSQSPPADSPFFCTHLSFLGKKQKQCWTLGGALDGDSTIFHPFALSFQLLTLFLTSIFTSTSPWQASHP